MKSIMHWEWGSTRLGREGRFPRMGGARLQSCEWSWGVGSCGVTPCLCQRRDTYNSGMIHCGEAGQKEEGSRKTAPSLPWTWQPLWLHPQEQGCVFWLLDCLDLLLFRVFGRKMALEVSHLRNQVGNSINSHTSLASRWGFLESSFMSTLYSFASSGMIYLTRLLLVNFPVVSRFASSKSVSVDMLELIPKSK